MIGECSRCKVPEVGRSQGVLVPPLTPTATILVQDVIYKPTVTLVQLIYDDRFSFLMLFGPSVVFHTN